MSKLNRLVSGAARRVGAWPLKAIGIQRWVEVLERLTEEAISVAKIPGGQIRFFTPSPLLISRATSVLSKEKDTIQWIDGFEDGTVFWDVGANVGVYSLYAALRKDVSVLSFEPSAANFHALSRNIHLNQLGDRVTGYCIALSGRTQLGTLNMASPFMGAAISQFGERGEMSRYWEGQAGAATQGMIGFTIDNFIVQFDPPFPNYLKLDVDGLELPILQGARMTLHDLRLRSLLVELSVSQESEYRKALSFLEEAGFHFVSRGATQGTQTDSAANHLFQRAASPVTSNRADFKHPVCTAESAQPAR
jgi:FkbM family methyltransferase